MKELRYFLHGVVSGHDSVIVNTISLLMHTVMQMWSGSGTHRNTVVFCLSEPAYLVQSLCHLYAFRYSLKTCKHPPKNQKSQVYGVSPQCTRLVHCIAWLQQFWANSRSPWSGDSHLVHDFKREENAWEGYAVNGDLVHHCLDMSVGIFAFIYHRDKEDTKFWLQLTCYQQHLCWLSRRPRNTISKFVKGDPLW